MKLLERNWKKLLWSWLLLCKKNAREAITAHMNKIDYIIILFDRKYFVTNITMECGQNMFDNESKCLEYFGVTEFWSIERKKT